MPKVYMALAALFMALASWFVLSNHARAAEWQLFYRLAPAPCDARCRAQRAQERWTHRYWQGDHWRRGTPPTTNW